MSAVVQLDDDSGRPVEPAVGDFTSSVSAPDIVFEKLAQLDVRPGCRVLEVGTASGYNAALLRELAGDGQVVTVEVDPGLSAWGAANLRAAGYEVTTVCGDGLSGCPAGGPYDRVLSTAALRRVPEEWLARCAPEAVIVTPFGTAYASGGLVRLRVNEGTASGRFTGCAWYMWARSHRPPRSLAPPEEHTPAASPLDPADVFRGPWEQDFVIGLRVPDIDYTHRGEGRARQVQLWDESGRNVTLVDYDHWWQAGAVRVFGRRNLWDEVVAAYAAWRQAGRPGVTRHGLTVDPAGQRAWLDTPENVVAHTAPQQRT
nr:methyltransferase domain-containing protein [Streptomyces sp. HNM0574]